MLHRSSIAALLLLLARAAVPAYAQEPFDPRFEAPNLPDPNEYRSASGRPGPAYWQQRADYEIRATLDPAAGTLTGDETITYANHSPDTLAFVWIQLDQNLFAPGSEGAQAFPTEAGDGFEGGFEIRSVQSGGRDLPRVGRRK